MQSTEARLASESTDHAATSLEERGRRFLAGAREDRPTWRRYGYVAAGAVNLILLVIVSSPLIWEIPYLTRAFVAPLAIIQLSLAATAAAELSFVLYDAPWFRHAARLGLSVIAFAATYTLLNVFPFEFPNVLWSDAMRLALVVALVGIVIGAVVEGFQLLFGWIRG
jgi:hypothetical protein